MDTDLWSVFLAIRRVGVFVLGVVVILDALLGSGDNTVPELVVGLVLVGVLPIEEVMQAAVAGRARNERTDRDVIRPTDVV